MDFSDLGFSTFADAAFARTRGIYVVTTQRMSPKRPSKCVALAQIETKLSPQPVQTIEKRDLAAIHQTLSALDPKPGSHRLFQVFLVQMEKPKLREADLELAHRTAPCLQLLLPVVLISTTAWKSILMLDTL